MMKVRAAQMFVFREAAVQRFEDRMCDYVRQTYPERHAELGDPGVRALVRKAMARARRHHIDGVGGTSVIIDLMARFGEAFENSGAAAWIDAMLARHELPADVRMESIIRHLTRKTGGRVLVRGAATGPDV
jgi:hypothetical protein